MSWLPNLLTLLRLLLTPLVVNFILVRNYRAALFALVVAGFTDALDGWLARRFRWSSRLGALVDPLADKLLLVASYLAMAASGLAPVWLAALIVARDAAILLFATAMLVLGKRRSFPPSVWGKVSTFFQITAGGVAVGVRAFDLRPLDPLVGVLFLLAALATAWSGFHYAWQAFHTPPTSARPDSK